MADSVDGRIERLLSEADEISKLNDGRGHLAADVVTWRKRAEAALADKLGSDSHHLAELTALDFYFNPSFRVNGEPRATPERNMKAFERAFKTAVALLHAALEARPRSQRSEGSPLVSIEQVGNRAEANASAVASIHVTADQLRQLIATAAELSPDEKGEGVSAVPDDDESPITLDRVEKLLSVVTKSKELLTAGLGFLLANADRITF